MGGTDVTFSTVWQPIRDCNTGSREIQLLVVAFCNDFDTDQEQ